MDTNDMATTRFDQAASSWDENPARRMLACNIATAIINRIPFRATMHAIDFGCGTGLVTLHLHSHVERMTGVDTSQGMLDVLAQKVQACGITNVSTSCLDLTAQPAPDLQADVIISAMALHHIPDVPGILQTLTQLLAPGGYLALADLDTEDGSFHPDRTGVYHDGFDRDWLMSQLSALGLQHLTCETAHVVERPDAEGCQRRYPVFLLCGQLL